MPNIPKPDLERGNYLVYTNEPDTVVDSPGSGGGGSGESYDVDFIVTLTAGTLADYATIPFFTIDGEEITGFEDLTEPDRQSIYKKTVTVKPGSVVEPNYEITGYVLDNFSGCYGVQIMGSVNIDDFLPAWAVIADKKIAELYAAYVPSDDLFIESDYSPQI